MNAARRYSQMQNETASPERLMVMLFTTALKHIRSGITMLETNQEPKPGEAARLFLKASEIVMEFHATLDRARAPQLCDNLAALYRFTALRLTKAANLRDVDAAKEAEVAFAPIADAFEQAVVIARRGPVSGVR